MSRVHNFNAGPAVMPLPVLEQVQRELLDYQGTGMSVMEMSHRSKVFEAIIADAEARLRKLMGISDDYAVLFLQGGASLQFSMVPMNLMAEGQSADVIMTGAWTQKAAKEIKRVGKVNVVASSEASNFTYIPTVDPSAFDPNAAFVAITSNNTIFGTQYREFPNTGSVPLVADMSSDILCRPVNVNQFGLIYAGAQKNVGPSGVTLVIVRKDLAERAPTTLPTMLQYRTQINDNSLYNTIPTFGVYMIGLVLKWIEDQGGLPGIAQINERKAAKLYEAIDSSDGFYSCPVSVDSRSIMNVVYRIQSGNEELEKLFVKQAESAGFIGIKGHRSVGGLRASIYNALPEKSVDALIEFMDAFKRANL
jgi:phosphoserine aminotransferase